MDPLVYVAGAILVGILLALVTFLRGSKAKDPASAGEVGDEIHAPAGRPVARRAGGARLRAGGARRGLAASRQNAQQDSEEEEDIFGDIAQPEGKVGAKKLRKLQDKAEKKAAREAELQAREEKKQQDAQREELRRKEEARESIREAALEEEEKRKKEEEEKREYEEYLKLKESFIVEEEGTHEAELNQDTESLLMEFINYIKNMKVVMLEDLASHFKLRTQDVIDRINTLQEEEKLTGVLDDRGKFIYITQEEYEAVAKFIRQRGRVSITELAESSNQLINLNPDNQNVLHSLLAEETISA